MCDGVWKDHERQFAEIKAERDRLKEVIEKATQPQGASDEPKSN